MAELVYNALGATTQRPCPTRPSQWFTHGHCSRTDVQMWRAAAANLYQLGILPLLAQLERIDAEAAAQHRPEAEMYRSQFHSLPESGSMLSTAQNLEAVVDVVGLMTRGDALIGDLYGEIDTRGFRPVEVGIPPTPMVVQDKSAWTRLIGPAVAVGGLAAVIGLVAVAARSSAKEESGHAE